MTAHPKRANSSVLAMLVILLIMAGVIYLFWQNADTQGSGTTETVIENTEGDILDTESTETVDESDESNEDTDTDV